LSDGSSVTDGVAKVVVADPRVVGVGDALFENMPGQTWRWSAVTEERGRVFVIKLRALPGIDAIKALRRG
jgi:hypothetical protein